MEGARRFATGRAPSTLDILFYADAIVDAPNLTIPHLRIPERDFVLAPLMDLDPELYHPRLDMSVRELWQRLDEPIPPRVMPIGERLWHWGQGARVMGILNMTPDSFAGDGLAGAPDPVAAALSQARRFEADGADVLDIGGYSTRPGHADLSVEEEIGRVTPVIRTLRDEVDVPLSIDTLRVAVAEAALDAGASWLNDVSGLRAVRAQGEENSPACREMDLLAARRRVPLVMMDYRAPLHVGKIAGDDQDSPRPDDIVSDVIRALTTGSGDGLPRRRDPLASHHRPWHWLWQDGLPTCCAHRPPG